jgi:hypothetical protein
MLFALTLGCKTTQFELATSPPGVDVLRGNVRLGSTPLKLDEKKLGKPNSAEGYLLRFDKPGFQPVWLWFPQGVQGVNVVVNLEPFLAKTRQIEEKMAKAKLDQVGEKMLQIQSELLLGSDVNQEAIADLTKDLPQLSTVYYLSALGELRKGNREGAKQRLLQALRISPEEPDYVVLYQELGGDPVADVLVDNSTNPDPKGAKL